MGSKASKKEARPAKTKAKRITVSTNDAEAYDPAKYPYYHEFLRICDDLERERGVSIESLMTAILDDLSD